MTRECVSVVGSTPKPFGHAAAHAFHRSGAMFSGAMFSGAMFSGAMFSGSMFFEAMFSFEAMRFSGAFHCSMYRSAATHGLLGDIPGQELLSGNICQRSTR
jgi:hypothetical protein